MHVDKLIGKQCTTLAEAMHRFHGATRVIETIVRIEPNVDKSTKPYAYWIFKQLPDFDPPAITPNHISQVSPEPMVFLNDNGYWETVPQYVIFNGKEDGNLGTDTKEPTPRLYPLLPDRDIQDINSLEEGFAQILKESATLPWWVYLIFIIVLLLGLIGFLFASNFVK